MPTELFNFGGSNQYADFPAVFSGMSNMSGAGTPGMPKPPGSSTSTSTPFGPGVVPPQSMPGVSNVPTTGPTGTAAPQNPYAPSVNSQYFAGSTLDPNLTANLFHMLQSQLGKGVAPFNLQSLLPSSGTATKAGTLTAPNNAILQQLFQGFTSGDFSSIPGMDTLSTMSQTGNPVDKLPAWAAMVDAMQRQIKQGEANLKEQFNVGGGLVGSPYGSAAADYESQTSKDLNAMLLGAQSTALENAEGRRLTAGQDIAGMTTQLGSLFQGLDQSSIDRLLQEFVRTSPQNNPLLNLQYGAGTTFPPYMGKSSGLGGLGAVMGNIGSIGTMLGGGIAGGMGAGAAGGSTAEILTGILAGICWITRAIYGDNSPQVPVVRRFLVRWGAKSDEGLKILRWYVDNGPALGVMIKLDPTRKFAKMFRPIFDEFYQLGLKGVV